MQLEMSCEPSLRVEKSCVQDMFFLADITTPLSNLSDYTQVM